VQFILSAPFHTAPPNPAFLSAEAVAGLARSAEDAGFWAIAFTEHPAPPEAWRATGGHDALDPFIALSFAAAVTTRLRLLTHLAVLAYRNPFLLAKTAASLDRLAGGRLVLGAGVGYLEGEYEALGVPFAERNDRFDEALRILPLAWSGEPVTAEGRGFRAEAVTCQPTPVQQPHPPIWLGGNSARTRDRVVAAAQGWMPFPNPASAVARRRTPKLETTEDLARMLADLRARADAAGRAEPIDVLWMSLGAGVPGTPAFRPEVLLAELPELRALGVTHLALGLAARDAAEAADVIAAVGEQVVARAG
jgi:probable F420-dependent oxidoreductase